MRHTEKGLLSMANSGPHTNGSPVDDFWMIFDVKTTRKWRSFTRLKTQQSGIFDDFLWFLSIEMLGLMCFCMFLLHPVAGFFWFVYHVFI